eukprot:TRINITY_DN23680_c0_g1_i1.p1 TRINITY_DN23680_c0_g1~~TRINITY_DN23680_c0_g1_i1.p1  ORF type:complete len:409 (+),score=73.19 TRINITY_DN23680_c0_g1_i1:168-1394(+)
MPLPQTDFRTPLLRHAEYRVLQSRFNLREAAYRDWTEAVLILQSTPRIKKPTDITKYGHVKDKFERRFSTKILNELLSIMAGKGGKDVVSHPFEVDVMRFPEPAPVDKLHFGSMRRALLLGLMPFSQTCPATKDVLIVAALTFTEEPLNATRDIQYSGWPEMSPLVRQALVIKDGKYYKKKGETYTFYLSDLGRQWATKFQAEFRQRTGFTSWPPDRPGKRSAGSPSEAEAPEAKQKRTAVDFPSYVKSQGAAVHVRGLTQNLEHNGKRGYIRGWNVDTGRYEVQLESGSKLFLRPANVVQKLKVQIFGVEKIPLLNGRFADILEFDDVRYKVLLKSKLDDGRDTFSLRPANIMLAKGECVVIQGLSSSTEHNGKMAQITEVDIESKRYTVLTQTGQVLKVQFGHVLV